MKPNLTLVCALCSLLCLTANAQEASLQVEYIDTDFNGVDYYVATSQYNGPGPHVLRVLEPDDPAPGVQHSFLYVLPVQPELGTAFGDGLEEVRLLNAHNIYNLTVIAPSFGTMPWYADHPTDQDRRYESFMVEDLQPWVSSHLSTESHYYRQRGARAEQHWLLGFSKSGYGGLSLLLRNPDTLTLGAFWDFPAAMASHLAFGANTNYGTQENFDANYRLTNDLLVTYAQPFVRINRIWINGSSLFKTSMESIDALLSTAGIQHTTALDELRQHSWTSGWVLPAIIGLYDLSINIRSGQVPCNRTQRAGRGCL